jgi:hypothetical protein
MENGIFRLYTQTCWHGSIRSVAFRALGNFRESLSVECLNGYFVKGERPAGAGLTAR